MEKQDVISKRFNISDITKDFSSDIKTPKPIEEEFDIIKFRLKKSIVEQFEKLKFNYAIANNIFGLTSRQFFCDGVNLIKNQMIKEKCFYEAPKSLQEELTRIGRRKKSNRTPTKSEESNILLKVNSEVNNDYFNILYSYYKVNDTMLLYEQYMSRNYFFYDFIESLNKYIK